MPEKWLNVIVAAVLAGSIMLTGCGSSDDDDSSDPPAETEAEDGSEDDGGGAMDGAEDGS